MGLRRGFWIAFWALLGALSGHVLEVTAKLAAQPALGPVVSNPLVAGILVSYATTVDIAIGGMAGMLAGDLLTLLQDEKPPTGRRVGITRGLIVVACALVGFHGHEVIADLTGIDAGEWIGMVGSTWVGAVLSDYLNV